MNKYLIKSLSLSILLFTGCAQNNLGQPSYTYSNNKEQMNYMPAKLPQDIIKKESTQTIDEVITNIADQLLSSTKLENIKADTVAITSFVDLHKFNKTTHFGRVLGESMYSELFKRGFTITDFRGQSSISINANGEYFISRDHKRLKSSFTNKYVLVGTYTIFNQQYMINVRIIDNISGVVVATARTFYDNNSCELSESCNSDSIKRVIKITTDNCTSIECPEENKIKL